MQDKKAVNVGTIGHVDHSGEEEFDLNTVPHQIHYLVDFLAHLLIPMSHAEFNQRRKFGIVMRYNQGEDLTKEEACIMIDCTPSTIPKMRMSKRNQRLRRMLGLLSPAERSAYDKEQHKQTKMNRGTDKIYALVDRALNNKTGEENVAVA